MQQARGVGFWHLYRQNEVLVVLNVWNMERTIATPTKFASSNHTDILNNIEVHKHKNLSLQLAARSVCILVRKK